MSKLGAARNRSTAYGTENSLVSALTGSNPIFDPGFTTTASTTTAAASAAGAAAAAAVCDADAVTNDPPTITSAKAAVSDLGAANRPPVSSGAASKRTYNSPGSGHSSGRGGPHQNRMAANRGWPVVEATECPSASGDSAPLHVPDVDMLGSPEQSLADLLANLPDPPNPPDLSDHRSSHLGPTSPTQLASEGGDESMAISDVPQGTSVLQQKKDYDDDDNNDTVTALEDDDDTRPRRDKGKAPETPYRLSGSDRRPNTKLDEEVSPKLQQAHDPSEPPMEDEHLRSSIDLAETATNADDSESSSRIAQSDAQDASYPSSVFDEAQDHNSAATTSVLADQVISWKQKQKQKVNPEAETEPLSKVSKEGKPFQPPSLGDPGWEKSAGRPPQKLPIRFRDAVGRNFLFPWEKAKTWTGMRKLVQSCFLHVDILGPHVLAGHYDLSINLPFPIDSANEALSPITPVSPGPSQASTSAAAEIPSTSTAAGPSSASGPSNGTNSQQQQPTSSFVVLPEVWDDTIEPGMLVVQHMWPLQTPNYNSQPVQPSPPQPHHHVLPPTRGRGAARGRGRGVGMFGGRGGVGANLFPPPPHPGSRTPMIVVNVDPPFRGKTRKRQDRI
ncbi:hypothetical protein F4859DRAFT_513256 [Xylaria cf. heliscus]|nr:hypothetical protein F4859DRAFT_513256 [Xylaria cf. heliscus]